LVTILLLNASIKKAFNPKGGVWPVKKEAPFPDDREMEFFFGGEAPSVVSGKDKLRPI
jgi:hypothetical protein